MGQAPLSANLGSDDDALVLRPVGALRRLADRGEARGVCLACAGGWPGEQIGDAVGVSRQSVAAKYGKDAL